MSDDDIQSGLDALAEADIDTDTSTAGQLYKSKRESCLQRLEKISAYLVPVHVVIACVIKAVLL